MRHMRPIVGAGRYRNNGDVPLPERGDASQIPRWGGVAVHRAMKTKAIYEDDNCPSCHHSMHNHRAVLNSNPLCYECLEVCGGPRFTYIPRRRTKKPKPAKEDAEK